MLSAVLKHIENKRTCPHCKTELTLCHAPPMHVGDGLGWGSEYLFVCLNDECSLFKNGWEYIENQYGHVGSYRYMELPNSPEAFHMMVAGKDAFTGSIVDVEDLKRRNVRFQKQQEALSRLETCLQEGDIAPVLTLLLDDSVPLQNRKRAAELLVPFNDLSCVEPLRNHVFKDEYLQMGITTALNRILSNHFLKECPYCAELIKSRALVCKHCHKELAG